MSAAPGRGRRSGGRPGQGHRGQHRAAMFGQPQLRIGGVGHVVERPVGALVLGLVPGFEHVRSQPGEVLAGLLRLHPGPAEILVEQPGREPLTQNGVRRGHAHPHVATRMLGQVRDRAGSSGWNTGGTGIGCLAPQ